MDRNSRPYRAISVFRSVLGVIRKEVRAARRFETGGALVGYVQENNIVVITNASGPGPNSELTRDSVLIDGSYTTDFCNVLFERSRGKLDYVGDWHRHTGWSLKSSGRDEEAMRTIQESGCCSITYPLSLIFRLWPEKMVGYAFYQNRLIGIPLNIVEPRRFGTELSF